MKEYFGILGGTFDPIHHGHLKTACSVLQQCKLQGIHVILSASPPHKRQPSATAWQRFEMLQLALRNQDRFFADDCELKLPKPSYTINTLFHLKNTYPTRNFCLILGADAFASFTNWDQWQRILEMLPIIVMTRPGVAASYSWLDQCAVKTLPPNYFFEQKLSDDSLIKNGILFLQVPAISISATKIRAHITTGQRIDQWVAQPVVEYIQSHGLYKSIH